METDKISISTVREILTNGGHAPFANPEHAWQSTKPGFIVRHINSNIAVERQGGLFDQNESLTKYRETLIAAGFSASNIALRRFYVS